VDENTAELAFQVRHLDRVRAFVAPMKKAEIFQRHMVCNNMELTALFAVITGEKNIL
jgi:hypothetical protein